MTRARLDAQAAFARLVAQVELGPRYCGAAGHARIQELLRTWLQGADRLTEHTFVERFFEKEVTCRNLWARFVGTRPGRLLLGTHYDTRPYADCDANVAAQRDPVPGANDGASGVALLCELCSALLHDKDRQTVDIVLFDAEDWHGIDGHEVSLGARRFVAEIAETAPAEMPDAVLIVDMVAGHDLMLDVDVTCQDHDASYALTLRLHQLGAALRLPAFAMKKAQPYKWVSDDHLPWRKVGVPSALLIDMDYPQWHTTHDLPHACSADSLAQMAQFIEHVIWSVD